MRNHEQIELPSVYGCEEDTGLAIDLGDDNGFHECPSFGESMPNFEL